MANYILVFVLLFVNSVSFAMNQDSLQGASSAADVRLHVSNFNQTVMPRVNRYSHGDAMRVGILSGQLDPDHDLMFDRDHRTEARDLFVQPLNVNDLGTCASSGYMARVLAISGGGVRGIGPADMCASIEGRSMKPLANSVNLFAGTSTGAIISTALTMKNPETSDPLYPANNIVRLYQEECDNIFQRRTWLGYLLKSKYKTTPAYETFARYFGNTKLSEIRDDADLLIPHYNLTNNHIDFFKSHKAKDPLLAQYNDFYLKDVIASTTAAPTYFRPFKLQSVYTQEHHGRDYIYSIDGGVVANDPSTCALTEAMSLYHNANSFLVVSMGTGSCCVELSPNGLLRWAKDISTILMNNTSEMYGHMLKKFGQYTSRPVFYSRLQFTVSPEHAAMDDISRENLTYLQHQVQSDNGISSKIATLSQVFRESDKPSREALTNGSANIPSMFLEI